MNINLGSNTLIFKVKEVAKKLWFRCFLYCTFSLAAFFLGSLLEPIVPKEIERIVTQDSLVGILTILASSMLAVTTFSLSTMVQAYATAATTATPRASKLIMENNTAQNALGTFIGAFLFSIVGLIGISSSYYDQGIISVLFIFTVIMILLIIVMLLKWIDQLSRLGRVGETINLIDKTLKEAIKRRGCHPTLFANELTEEKKSTLDALTPVVIGTVGYIKYIDFEQLDKLAEKNSADIYIAKIPGSFLDGISPLAYISIKNKCDCSDEFLSNITNSFVIGNDRTFSQDPRYGFVILSEIGLRALSPAVNDPGTAIDIIGSYVRAITLWQKSIHLEKPNKNNDSVECTKNIKYHHVYIEKIDDEDIFDDMYSSLMPAASSHIAVAIRLKKSLLSIRNMSTPELSKIAEEWITYFDSLCEKNLTDRGFERITQLK